MKLEEMAKTLHDGGYISADMVRNWDGLPDAYKRAYRAGLLAVMEKHVGPMLVQAREELFNEVTGNGVRQPFDVTPHHEYAARIISSLTANPPAPEVK